MNRVLLVGLVPIRNGDFRCDPTRHFDGSAKTEKHGGHGSRSWILGKLPAWDIVVAASAHLPSTTVNIAEYTGMNNGVKSAIEHGVTNLIIVGDSRLAIQQSMGVIAGRKETLQLKLSQHKELTAQLKSTRYLHVVRAYNAAADSLATEALESQVTKVVLNESRKTELKALNEIPEVLYVDEQALAETNLPAQRMQPIPQTETHAVFQTVEEPQVTAVTRNQSRQVRFAESTRHRPTSQEAVNEVDDLPADQDSPISPQGGAQRSATEGTGNLETTLDEPVRADPKEAIESEDPTTVQIERIRRVRVAQDEERRWADLKTYLRGDVESPSFKRAANASKLAERFVLDEDGLLQYVGKGRKLDEVGEHEPQLRLVIPTTMIDEVLQSCHDSNEGGHQGITRTFHRVKKDYYWVGLYQPQANGQQQRSVKSIVETVNVYVEDPLQQDWDDIAEKMAHAINNSMDTTRKETHFYLVHGWDAQSTLNAMTSSLRLGDGSLTDAAAWRREANRQHEVALAMAKPYQATEKPRRAKEHNEALGRLERMVSSVAVYGTSKTRLTKMLAHWWHGPFRIKRKVEEFAYQLELPDKAGYRFYPVVHVSRLKPVREDNRRPTAELVDGLGEDDRFDFDDELLPEDSWEPEAGGDEYVVEAILDDRWPISTDTERNQREFYVKWRGYDDPTWEPVSKLSCGGLLFDFLLQRKRENRFQMVHVADKN
ncbi:unnamed protein product [Phytophthora fragariaefolia]|uniref:Unnamed protein product n=1 Tax=Phytophthora fragariaefolia TaxID=1490495 RepID=A0A9W6X5T4_9STRA|nr:unnamed protein product [Phytophthora fragariaefolia]